MKNTLRLLLLLLPLAACTTTPPQLEEAAVADPQAAWQHYSHWLGGLQQWDIEGRIALRSYDQAVNANLYWRQIGDSYTIEIRGPLGQGGVSLSGAADGARLVSGEVDATATDAQGLLFDHTGYVIPIDALKYWIRGLPQPAGGGIQQLDPQGRLAQIEQDLWKVRIRAYARFDGHTLPQKVFVDNHRLSVRIFIDKWTLHAS